MWVKRTACLLVLVVLSLPLAAQDSTGRVLIIESYHPSLAWTAQCDTGIASVLEPHYELHYWYMDTKRISPSEFENQADKAWAAYQQLQPDLVMIGDDNGLRLLGPRFASVATPVVFFGINNNPRYYFETFQMPANITGVLERTPIIPLLRHLPSLLPDLSRVLILLDKSPTSDAIARVVFQGQHTVRVSGLTATYRIARDWDDWQAIVEEAQSDLILMPTFHAVKTASGATVSVEEVVSWTSAHSRMPLFTNQDYAVGDTGAVGAYVIYGVNHGRLAAEVAREILEIKRSPGYIVTDDSGRFYFNATQLQRFGIRLPDSIRTQAEFR